jgi:S-adenosylmethionine:tRNA ribosyltransferase-isomerase
MKPATGPRHLHEATRMLLLDANQATVRDTRIAALIDILQPGDLFVVNDAATLPSSLSATTSSNAPIEIRVLGYAGGTVWNAALLGPGDWRTPTELREPPERVQPGTTLHISDGFSADVIDVAHDSGRLVTIRFSRDVFAMWAGIYAYGRPIQYSYLRTDLPLWSIQTSYAGRPWAVEMPSAGQPLTWQLLLELRCRGVGIARITHAAGISAIGDDDLDARLPFSERYDIPQPTIEAIEQTRARGGRVIATGTTVVRALEACAAKHGGHLVAGEDSTDLVIDQTFHRRIVDGILTGVHQPEQSHFRLLRAFAGEEILVRAWRHATEAGYLCHEFGDACLILAGRARRARPTVL